MQDYTDEQAAEALSLMEEGMDLMSAGEFDEAERILRRAVDVCAIPRVMNNLAALYVHRGEHEEALAVLEPNLLSGEPSPYAHATAARCHIALGRPDEAAAEAERAVQDFQAGRPTGIGWMFRSEEAGWYEYVVPVFRSLGDLGEHRRIWQLYQQWQTGIDEPAAHYYAGIAAFNLGRFRQAERAWRRVKDKDWRFLEGFSFMAELCRTDGLPGLVLDYRMPTMDMDDIPDTDAADGEDSRRIVAWLMDHPANLMLHLGFVLSGHDVSGGDILLKALVHLGGEWGEEFGRKLLRSGRVPDRLKMPVLSGLIAKGVLDPGAPVEVVFDGELREILLREGTFELTVERTPQREARYLELRELLEQGELERVREELEAMIFGNGVVWAQLVLLYADALRMDDDLEGAEHWYELLLGELPGNPAVLIELARLRFSQGGYDEAEDLLEEIDLEEVLPDHREQVRRVRDELLAYVRLARLPDIIAGEWEEKTAEHIEDKPLHPTRTTLQSALRKVPVEWLDAACDLHLLDDLSSLRQEREQQLARWLLANTDRALQNLASFDPHMFDDAVDLLEFLLEEGGWAKKGRVTRRFGTDEDDGFFWHLVPPESTLGLLRLAGLVYVGRTTLDGRRWKIAGIPVDLREVLQEAVDGL